jgi:hypothetical protein
MKRSATFCLEGDRAAFILALDSADEMSIDFSDRITRKFKDAADQLSGLKRGVIFAEFEGPWPDPPLVSIMEQACRSILLDLFQARPSIELIVLGFPGPPFSVGTSFAIRNPRNKRRGSSDIVRILSATPNH